VKAVDAWIPFQVKWDFPQTQRDGQILVVPFLKNADARSTSSRKMIVRVNVSIWGTGSSHSADRTDDINKTSAYKTISDYGAMLPGDLLCKANSHVVMFLYYASADKSKIMIIENGGAEKGTNTVHCDVHTLSSYKSKGYRVRRLASLG
jgi:hypothetical protein